MLSLISFLRAVVRIRRLGGVVAVGVVLVGFARSGLGQCVLTEQQTFSKNLGFTDEFGRAIAVDGGLAVVGQPLTRNGAVHVYRRQGTEWVQDQRLVARDGAFFDYFGVAVAVGGDRIVVGARFDDDLGRSSGSVYVFREQSGQWVQEAKLLASDGGQDEQFGFSLAIDGDWLVVGTPFPDRAGEDSGAVYVFHHDGTSWMEEAILTPSDSAERDLFGVSVSLDGDFLVVGAPGAAPRGDTRGRAYVFHHAGIGWIQQARLVASDAEDQDRFGGAVAIDGSRIAVGAVGWDGAELDQGAVYLFEPDGARWSERQRVEASMPVANQAYGAALDLDGDSLLVGAPGDDQAGQQAGAGYYLRRRAARYEELARLVNLEADALDSFGFAVALGANTGWIGAPSPFSTGTPPATASVYSLPELPLDVHPALVTAGDVLNVSVCGGNRGALLALFVVEVAGMPDPRLIALDRFDASGGWTASAVIPPGIAGLDPSFAAFTVRVDGGRSRVLESNEDRVEIR